MMNLGALIDHSGKVTAGLHSAVGQLYTGVSISVDGVEIWKYGKKQRVNLSKDIAGLKAYCRRYARGKR